MEIPSALPKQTWPYERLASCGRAGTLFFRGRSHRRPGNNIITRDSDLPRRPEGAHGQGTTDQPEAPVGLLQHARLLAALSSLVHDAPPAASTSIKHTLDRYMMPQHFNFSIQPLENLDIAPVTTVLQSVPSAMCSEVKEASKSLKIFENNFIRKLFGL